MKKKHEDTIKQLVWLHDQIEKNPKAGEKMAIQKVVKDVKVAAKNIAAGADRVISQFATESHKVVAELNAEAETAVNSIRKGASQAALDLIGDIQEGADKKMAALAAKDILQKAEQIADELNRQATDTLDTLVKQTDAATARVEATLQEVLTELVEVKGQAVKQVANATKSTAKWYPANAALDNPETLAARKAATEVIKMLAQASESITHSVTETTARVQQAATEASAAITKAATEANASVRGAIDEANEKILDVTGVAIKTTVGKEEATLFDLEPLKEKWGTRNR